jgi:hypothetical protein
MRWSGCRTAPWGRTTTGSLATAWRRRAPRPSSPIAVILQASRPPAWGGCPIIAVDREAVTPSPGEDDSEPDECGPLRTARLELKLCQALAALDPSPDLRAPLHARIAAQLWKLPRYNATDQDTRQPTDLTDDELREAAVIIRAIRALPTWPTMSYQGNSGLRTALGGYFLLLFAACFLVRFLLSCPGETCDVRVIFASDASVSGSLLV